LSNETTIYEQRHVTLRTGGLAAYVAYAKEQVWPELNRQGAKVVCLLNGFIGQPQEEVMQITRFPDWDTWNGYQQSQITGESGLVEKEEARLLKAVASRPKDRIPAEDRRAVYGYRRYFIRPGDIADFAHFGENGVWPRIESQGACILGLWTTLAVTDPSEVILVTGYHGPGHWEETRVTIPKPEDVDFGLWRGDLDLRARREAMTLKTWVCLMQAIEVAPYG